MSQPAKHPIRGTFTALVTPFNQDQSIDFGALTALVDMQLEANITGMIPCGTTGEAVTLSEQEQDQVIGHVIRQVAGRSLVIAGTGSNNTLLAAKKQQRAKDLGADCGLVVTPYYNKPTAEGLYQHYAYIAEHVDLPLLLYNVPSRTGCDLTPQVVQRLLSVGRIVGIKEAVADLDRITALRALSPHFSVLSGDDATACAATLMGADGVISVASNLLPKSMHHMIEAALRMDVPTARLAHTRLRPVLNALFIEANPIPVKAAMAQKSWLQEVYRLPLCPMKPENKQKLHAILQAYQAY